MGTGAYFKSADNATGYVKVFSNDVNHDFMLADGWALSALDVIKKTKKSDSQDGKPTKSENQPTFKRRKKSKSKG